MTTRRRRSSTRRVRNTGLKQFSSLKNRPHIKSRGVQYVVEEVEEITECKGLDGDLVKKYVDGKLVKQIYVSKKKMNEIFNNIKVKIQSKGGNAQKPQIQYVQQQPQQQEVIAYEDKTTFGQNLKSSFAFGVGLQMGAAVAQAALGAIFGNN